MVKWNFREDAIQISEMLRFFPNKGKNPGLGYFLPGDFHKLELDKAYLSYV